MSAPSRSLRQLLLKNLTDQTAGETQVFHNESERIDMLQGALETFEDSGMSLGALKATFLQYGPQGFDIEAFIAQKVEEGVYGADALVDNPEDDLQDDEDLGPNVIPFQRRA